MRVKSDNRNKRSIQKTKTREFKKKRKASEYEKIKKETKEARSARAKCEGSVYKPGIGMTGGYDETELVNTCACSVANMKGMQGKKKIFLPFKSKWLKNKQHSCTTPGPWASLG